MFVITLRFADKSRAALHMDAHKAWIRMGLQEGVFVLVGSIQPNAGGAIIAHNTSLPALQERLAQDPFVAQGVVTADILEIAPSMTDERLAFLKDEVAA